MSTGDIAYYQDTNLTDLATTVDALTTGSSATYAIVTEPILENTQIRGHLFMQALKEL